MQNSTYRGQLSTLDDCDVETTLTANYSTYRPDSEACEAGPDTSLSSAVSTASDTGLSKLARPLTQAQIAFAEGVSRGKTHKQAYRDAYPGDSSSDAGISTSASRLIKDPRIQKLLRDAQELDIDALVDDRAALRRYVMTQLLRCARGCKGESTKIKALELIGRATGMFQPAVEPKAPPQTAEQIKRELSQRLAYLEIAASA